MSAPALSLVIAVYRQPERLRLVLEALKRQSWTDAELLVADDGSAEDIAELVRELRAQLPFPVRHLWHEDKGWRKNVMLNSAIREAHGAWMVFIDGDCIPHRRFLEDHAANREEGVFLCGRRAEMSARWTAALDVDGIRSGRFERIGSREWWEGVRGAAVRVEDALRFESPLIRRILHASPRGMLGSNFSVAREHLLAINGFDEAYDGPGLGEDSDVQFRLELLGLRAKSIRHLAIQYHMHHPRTSIPQRSKDLYEHRVAEGRMRCRLGIVHETDGGGAA